MTLLSIVAVSACQSPIPKVTDNPKPRIIGHCRGKELPLSELYKLTAKMWDLEFDIAPDVFLDPKTQRTISVTLNVKNMEERYWLAWLVRLSGAGAKVVDGKIRVARNLKGNTDQAFLCYQDTAGKWLKDVNKALDAEISMLMKDMSTSQVLDMLITMTGICVIIDPKIVQDGIRGKVSLDVKNVKCHEVFAHVITKAGLTYCAQGGVVFITKLPKD